MEKPSEKFKTANAKANYNDLGALLEFATREIQKIFLARYENLTKEKWGRKSFSGYQFFRKRPENERLKTYANAGYEDQKKLEGDASEWDIAMLHLVLSNIDFSSQNSALKDQHDEENKQIKEIQYVGNKYLNPTQKQIRPVDLEHLWEKAKTALVALGSSASEIDGIRAPRIATSFKLFEPPIKNFTGRKEILQKIHKQMLQCSNKFDFLDRIVVLCGPDGIGKSELARMYAKTYIADPIIQNVAWIDAKNETCMKVSFVNLAKTLKIPLKNKELDETIKDVYDHFSNHIKTGLFIFDNSQQINERPFGIHKYLPIQESLKWRPLVLLTTRHKAWVIPNEVNVFEVNELSQEESIELLQKKHRLAKEHENYEDYKKLVAKLADALQGYPLGLALASSNIKSNRNWAGLKAGMEAYLKRMEEPLGKDEPGAAAKYQVIFKDVLEVTLEKIKALRRPGRNALKALHIMDYFPPHQIQKEQIQSIFQACYSTTLTSSAFRILEKYSLIKMDTLQGLHNTKVTRLIRIQPLVQDSIREKLDREKDISFLLSLCNYFSYTGYNEAYREKEPLIRLHEFLKDRKWPQNSIHFSLIFVSIMTRSLNLEDAINLSRDIYTFLNMKERENSKISNVENDVTNLFSLCMFWINQSKYGNEMRQQFKLEEEELESLFISTVQPATEFLLTSAEGPKSLKEHSYLLCIELLQYLIRSGNVPSLVIPLIIQTLNKTACSSAKYISKLYDTLWLCLKSDVPESLTLLGPVLQKHFQIYTCVVRGPYYSNVQFYDYWLEDRPLDLRFIYEQLQSTQNHKITNDKKAQFPPTNAFLDTFIEAGGEKILQQHITYLTLYKVPLGDTHLLLVLRSLALYCSTRDTLIGSLEFLTVFADFTELILEEQYLPLHKFTCIMTWFSLFATQKPKISNFFSRTCSPSIYSMASVLHHLLNQLKNLENQDYLDFDYLDNEAVIRTFLETHKDEPDSLAFRTANCICKNAKEEGDSAGKRLDTASDEIEMLRLKEKLQLLQQTDEGSWRLLCILAYLPNDTAKAKIEDIFWFVFREDGTEDAFRSLNAFKDELLRSECLIKGWRRWTDADLIQIFDVLKLCVRNELLLKNESACLLGVSNLEMWSLLKDGSNRKGHLSTLHEHLRDFKWPRNSTHISMEFSVFLTTPSRYLNTYSVSIKFLEDVYEFSKSVDGAWYKTPNFKLFQLCLFVVNLMLNQMDAKEKMWEDPHLNPHVLSESFLAMIKPCIEHFLNPETNLPRIQSSLLRTTMYILKSLPRQMDKVESELRKQILSTILDSVNATSGCETESTSDLLGVLYNLAQNESVSDSVDLIVTIFRKHLQIYTLAFVTSAGANLKLYWEHAGPLRLVVRVSKNCVAHDKSAISNCFIANEGPKILVDYLLYRNTHEPTDCTADTDLFRFIHVIAYEFNHAERLINSPRFLNELSQFTSQSMLRPNNDFTRGEGNRALRAIYNLFNRNYCIHKLC